MFTDSHCHLTYEPLFEDLDNILENCKKNNIIKLLTISTNLQTSKNSILISKKYQNVFCAIGIHPNSSKNEFNEFEEIKSISKKSEKIIGIGETGLDYFKYKENKKIQIESFLKHVELAKKLNLPVIVHNRNSDNDLLNIISTNVKNNSVKFLIHCYTGSLEFAEQLLKLGCLISFSGIITFKKSEDLRNVVKKIPLENILIETDAPFLSPEPFRGRPNTPVMIKYVAEAVANIKKKSIDEVANQTTYNFNNFFFKK